MPDSQYNAALLKDRGNIKWTAMMLPEHREMLYAMDIERYDVDPPSYDEYELAALAEKLARAMHNGNVISVRYWKNKREYELAGIVKRIDPIKRAVLITHDDDDRTWIPAVHIFGVSGGD